MKEYAWENFGHPKRTELREKYNVNEAVSLGKYDYEQQLLLKNWVANILHNGTPKDYSQFSAYEILYDAKHNHKFWRTEYALIENGGKVLLVFEVPVN
jgi:hypothetical protein